MHASLALRVETLFSFLLVLARVAGAFSFVPFPGFTAAPGLARPVFVLGLSLALFPVWPTVTVREVTPSTLVAWGAGEAVLGIAIGLSIAIVLEAFLLAAQVLGLQAGYAYAQTVDPSTQADSGILLVFAQLMAGVSFFALGLDREVIRLFAGSLAAVPPGSYIFGPRSAEPAIRLASLLFPTGVRLALPVVALLVMVDVALALVGRLNSQMQLLSLAFPVKMLAALLVLSFIAGLFPRVLSQFAAVALAASRRILGL